MGPCAAFLSLTPPGVTPELFQHVLSVSDFASQQSKTTVAVQVTEWPVLMCDPWINKYFNEWVSLWDHHTVWGLGLHHSHRFLSRLRKARLARRRFFPFLRSKVLIYSPQTFILTNSIMAVKLRRSVRSASYLTTQPRPFSPLQQSNIGIFQLSPRYFSTFSHWAPLSSNFSLGRQFPWHLSARLLTQHLLTGLEFLSFNQALLRV